MPSKPDVGGPVQINPGQPDSKRELRPQHVKELEKRAISEEFALKSGVRSKADNEVKKLGFAPSVLVIERKNGMQGILFEYWNLTRETQVSCRLKPDQPFIIGGKPAKYISRKGDELRAYYPHTTRPEHKTDTNVRALITEGEFKALSLSENIVSQPIMPAPGCVIGLQGVNGGWKRDKTVVQLRKGGNETRKQGPPRLIADLDDWDWQGRFVYIVFDSDVGSRDNAALFRRGTRNGAWGAEYTLVKLLRAKGAVVRIVVLPPKLSENPGAETKNGIDDLIAERGAERTLRIIAQSWVTSRDPNADVEFERREREAIQLDSEPEPDPEPEAKSEKPPEPGSGVCPVCGRETCKDPSHVPPKDNAPPEGNAIPEGDTARLPTFHSAGDVMKEPRPVEVVEGVAWENHITVAVSESGVGKTFLLLSLSAAVSSNVSWLGRYVQHGSVAYVSYEGDALGLRLRAIKEAQGHKLDNLYFLRAYDPLSPIIDHDRHEISSPGAHLVMAELTALSDSLAASGRPPIRLLVIDTIRASLTGSEDSSEPVAAYLRAVRRIVRQVPGAGAILAHHAGWQDGEAKRKRERGSSAFRGNSDSTLYIELDGEDPERGEARLLLRTYKVRDSERPAPLSCIRRRVSLNETDMRGEPATSCVIEPDRRSRAEREAETASAHDAENRILDLRALRIIADRPELATSQNSIRIALGLQRQPAYEAIARLLALRWVNMPEKQRKPYTLTELGRIALQEGSA